jgi:aerobic-type carbon monoxide dehydrogenase small subunit (CoxS/CutS family)
VIMRCNAVSAPRVHAFLPEQPAPTADEVRDAVSDYICRCTGYVSIVILDASRHFRVAS